MKFFKIVSIITSALFVYLFFIALFNPESFFEDVGLQSSETASIVARRTSMFMLGISILLAASINLSNSKVRQFICLATGITMLGLASMGSYELIRGSVNYSIFISITIETLLGGSFIIIFLSNLKSKLLK